MAISFWMEDSDSATKSLTAGRSRNNGLIDALMMLFFFYEMVWPKRGHGAYLLFEKLWV